MTPTSRKILFPLAISILLAAAGCKTTQPSSPQQTQRPPSPSQSPSSSPSMPSPPTPPSSPGSPSSQPSSPSVAMPSPSMPSPSQQKNEQKGEQKGEHKGEQGDTAEQTAQQSREKAGSDLEQAGEAVASAGEQIGDAAAPGSDEPPEFPIDDQQAAGEGEPDTMMPESDTASSSDEIAFEDAETAAGGGSAGAQASAEVAAAAAASGADGEAGETPAEAAAESESAGDPWQENGDDFNVDAIAAAEAAMIEAGIKLQEAGAAVRSAESDADMARASDLLSEARVILIVAGQDLIAAREAAGEDNAAIFDAANDALNDATVAVVIATDAVMGMPEFEDLQTAGIPGTPGSDRIGELEDELEQSLIVFDGQIIEARTVLVPSLPGSNVGIPLPGPANSEPSMSEGDLVGVGDEPGALPGTEAASDTTSTGESSGANSVGNAEMSGAREGDEQVALIPDDVGTGQNDDIVAQQLREAAVAETDPALREKLWQEYRRYKSGS